jgi:hypothetical protein
MSAFYQEMVRTTTEVGQREFQRAFFEKSFETSSPRGKIFDGCVLEKF